MCTVCGCDQLTEEHLHSKNKGSHRHDSHVHHSHSHHSHSHDSHSHHYGQNVSGLSVPGFSQSKLIEIERNILSKNDNYADLNRIWLTEASITALNILSSPGAGKTSLLVETLQRLSNKFPVSVIEGDQETSNDADRIRSTGAQAVQINTGKGCHLDAHMVGHALSDLEIEIGSGGVVFIENVGNLVCPALFDLGEDAKVVVLSTTEGEDKPIKYPDMFQAADILIISKIDLLPYVDFNVDQAIEYARRVNPDVEVLLLSTKSGEGMSKWIDWIQQKNAIKSREPLSLS